MNLQNIITYRENKEEESKTNTLENYMDNNKNIQENEKDFNNDEINNYKKDDSSYGSNNDSDMKDKEIDNKNEYNISNNKEHNIENNFDNNNIDIDNINNNEYANINTNNNFNYNENENNINNLISENNNNINTNVNNNKEEKIPEKDIIDELIEKIRNNQDLGIPKENPKKAFEQLNDELKLGLEQLNQIKTNSNRKTILDTQNELERKSYERNKKYNEVIDELTKKIEKQTNDECQYKRGTYYNYKNMYIMKPSYYIQTERRSNIFEYPRKNENKFYMSSIDGKIIVNGERKNLEQNLGQNNKRSFSGNKKKNIGTNNNWKDFGMRKVRNYDKNYFVNELNKIDKLLFS